MTGLPGWMRFGYPGWRCRWFPWLPRWWWTGLYGPVRWVEGPVIEETKIYGRDYLEDELRRLEEEKRSIEEEIKAIKERLKGMRG